MLMCTSCAKIMNTYIQCMWYKFASKKFFSRYEKENYLISDVPENLIENSKYCYAFVHPTKCWLLGVCSYIICNTNSELVYSKKRKMSQPSTTLGGGKY